MDTTPDNWYELEDKDKIETPLEKEIAAFRLEVTELKSDQDLTLLMYASMVGNEKAVLALIKSGESINEKNSQGLTALSHAVLASHFNCVQILVANGADINVADGNGDTPIMLAATQGFDNIVQCLLSVGATKCQKIHKAASCAAVSGNLKCLQTLVKAGADIDLPDTKGRTILMKSAGAGQLDVVACLIHAGADINEKCKEDRTALSYAASNGHLQCVEILHTSVARLNLTDCDGQTPLMKAAKNGHTAIVEYLVKFIDEEDLNVCCKEGKTALFHAAENGNLECVKAVIKTSKVDIDKADIDDQTPLMSAICRNHPKTVAYLLSKGANCDAISKAGMTAIHCAATVGKPNIFQNVLLHDEKKIKETANLKNADGQTPLMIAAANRHELLVNFLLEERFQVDVDVQCNKAWTAAHYAAENGRFSCIKSIVSVSKGINVQTEDGKTCLMIACAKGMHNVVSLLIRLKADVNLQCSERRSALHYAVIRGSIKCADKLIKAGAHIHLWAKEAQSPLMLAINSRQTKMAEFLREHGAKVEFQNNEDNTAVRCVGLKTSLKSVAKLTGLNANPELNEKSSKKVASTSTHTRKPKYAQKFMYNTDFDLF